MQDVASILGVASRHDLGIVGAAKGLIAGRLRFRFRARQVPPPPPQGGTTAGPWQVCGAGAALIDSDWVRGGFA